MLAGLACVCRGEDAPAVTAASFTVNGDGTVAVSYTLADAPAIITLDVLDNGVSIGDGHVRRLAGDVNKVVEPGERSATWYANADWEGSSDSLQVKVSAWKTNAPPDYLSVDLENGDVRYYTSSNSLPAAVTSDPYAGIYSESRLLLRRINAANVRWPMGSPSDESGRSAGREAIHYVTMTNDFYIGVFELSQYQWRAIEGTNLVNCKNTAWVGRDAMPVESVSYNWIRGEYCYWPDAPLADSFLGRLRARTGLAFDLPSESQWEYAARAGHYVGCWGDGSEMTAENLKRLAWYSGNNPGGPTYIGMKAPNDWGLYDVLGNCWEWTLDNYVANITANTRGEIEEPSDRTSDAKLIVRGGCYYSGMDYARPAQRGTNSASDTNTNGKCGFRLCLTLPGVAALDTPLTETPASEPAASLTSAAQSYEAAVSCVAVTATGATLDTRVDGSAESDAGTLDTTAIKGALLILR